MRAFFYLSFFVLALTFQNCTSNTEPATLTDGPNDNEAIALAVKQDISPAFSEFDVEAQTVTVKGTEAQSLELPSGSSIDVPAAAFVDADGKAVEGDVDIVFREFHNAAEIIASGIPMKVMGEDGEEGWMQTAGMYEINGSQNGNPIFIAEGKSLNVNLVSDVDGEYGFWNFDEEAGNWDNLGTSTPTPNPNLTNIAPPSEEQRRKAGPASTPPLAYDGKTTPIDLDVNLKNFPELADKQSVVWQYASKDPQKDPAKNPKIFQNQWDDIDLHADADGQTYTLTLANDDETVSLTVAPTLTGKDLEKALADYQYRLASYKKKLASFEEVNDFKNMQNRFVRSYAVQGFGIYNYDILRKMSNTIPLLANFDFGMEIPPNMRKHISIFLIAEGGKMVVNFPPNDWKKFQIDPDMENSIVAVLPGNKIATLSKEDIKKQISDIKEARGQNYVFNMNLEGDAVSSVEEMEDRMAAL